MLHLECPDEACHGNSCQRGLHLPMHVARGTKAKDIRTCSPDQEDLLIPLKLKTLSAGHGRLSRLFVPLTSVAALKLALMVGEGS